MVQGSCRLPCFAALRRGVKLPTTAWGGRHKPMAMRKAKKRENCKEALQFPRLAVGDVLLVGKFKNRRVTITGFSSDENNQPVAQTDKGEHKIFKPRIAKLMPTK
jgi:hypothetical protein